MIAYECYDCGRFHVGHADNSQRLVREEVVRKGVCPPRPALTAAIRFR